MNEKETLEIYKYARQSGFQAAWMMFGVCVMFLLIIGGLIGAHLYYVKKTYETPPANIITANTTQTKIDFYAYQDLRDRLSEEQRKVLTLENQLFVKDQLAPVNAQLASIQCHMLKRPDVTGIGAVCPNAGIINGLGINSLNGYNCGCGYNNLA